MFIQQRKEMLKLIMLLDEKNENLSKYHIINKPNISSIANVVTNNGKLKKYVFDKREETWKLYNLESITSEKKISNNNQHNIYIKEMRNKKEHIKFPFKCSRYNLGLIFFEQSIPVDNDEYFDILNHKDSECLKVFDIKRDYSFVVLLNCEDHKFYHNKRFINDKILLFSIYNQHDIDAQKVYYLSNEDFLDDNDIVLKN